MSVDVGVMFDAQEGLDWDRWGGFAREIEQAGFESLWASDHLVSLVGFPRRPRVDVWTALTWLATATERLRIGPLVSPITWRHPSILALTAAAVDALSGGRLEVGIGAGWNEYEHSSFGIALPPTSIRFEMLDESAEILRRLWTEEEASFAGRHFTLDRAHGHPRPVQRPHPPLIIGGIGERRTLALVARHADEWNAYGLVPEAYRAKLEVLERHCARVGRNHDDVRRSVAAPIAIAETEQELARRIERLADVFPMEGIFPPELAPFTAAKLRGHGWFAGTPAQIVEQIEAFGALGVRRVMVQYLDVEDHDSLALLARDVLPALRGSAGTDRQPSSSH